MKFENINNEKKKKENLKEKLYKQTKNQYGLWLRKIHMDKQNGFPKTENVCFLFKKEFWEIFYKFRRFGCKNKQKYASKFKLYTPFYPLYVYITQPLYTKITKCNKTNIHLKYTYITT